MQRSATRLVFLAIALIAGCAPPPPRPTFADIRFSDEPPIQLDVARLEVVNAYQAPFKAPNVDQLFPIPPEHALENWAHDRLRTVGTGGSAVFTIRNAAVVETDLKIDQGLATAFTDQPAERYDLTIQASLEAIDPSGATRSASVTTTRSRSLLQGVTPNDRDKAFYDMTKAAMADFDRQMETEIRNNFGTFAR